MNELTNLVAQKTGIPADKAQHAVETVVAYLKEKLPGPVGSQIDSLVAGGAGSGASGLADKARDIGGMLGNR
ncbi:MAG TPA: hypothetical protein VJ803_08545 [Gemmatimonadaceae bacterium]|nr:hypothetical protein [Gemmatimonadaceae bacterium]